MISMDLLLQCPECRAPMTGWEWSGKGIMCGEMRHQFPIVNGVPRFVDSGDAGFTERWKRFRAPQATTAGVLWHKTGWTPNDLNGSLVLDAGCGCGRFSSVASAAGATVIGVDASSAAIDAAQENAPNASFAQASLLQLPFRDGTFDKAFSVGVLMHTADSEAAFREIARTVKPGGELAVWVYAKPLSDDNLFAPYEMLHEITRAVPPDALYSIFEKWAVRVRDGYAGAWGPLQQVLRVSNSTDDEECVSDTLDWHAPEFRRWHTKDEVCGWFDHAGFDVLEIGPFPVSIRGVKRG